MGVKYVNIFDGLLDIIKYVDFVGEVVNSFIDDGERVIQVGDVLVVDNVFIYYYVVERILRNWFFIIGVEYLFLLIYFLDLNLVE